MAGSTDYSLVTCSQHQLVCAAVYTARTSRPTKTENVPLLCDLGWTMLRIGSTD